MKLTLDQATATVARYLERTYGCKAAVVESFPYTLVRPVREAVDAVAVPSATLMLHGQAVAVQDATATPAVVETVQKGRNLELTAETPHGTALIYAEIGYPNKTDLILYTLLAIVQEADAA